MEILGCIWLDQFVDKIIQKHNLYPEEVEDMFNQNPQIRKVEKGEIKGRIYTWPLVALTLDAI